jgi:hypothetical protein
MKIILTASANIRQAPTTNSKIIGAAYIGQIFDSSGIKHGENVAANSKWYELTVGGYIWAGNAKEYVKTEIVKYSQSDWRWSWRKLGYSSWATLGDFGCALTSCAMLCGIDPHTLNEYMKRVRGYVQDTMLVWTALEKATNGKLKYIGGLGEEYDNERCKAIIKREKACIVQVWSSNIPMHFVVAIGNGEIIDPIDGKIKSFGTYWPVSLREITRL